MSDIFNIPIYVHKNEEVQTDSSVFGAALRAIHGYENLGKSISFSELFQNSIGNSIEAVAFPDKNIHEKRYKHLYTKYCEFEDNCEQKYQYDQNYLF